MQIDRRLVSSFDWPLFVLSIGLALLGIMTIYSATCSVDEECSRYLATKQSYWLVIGMVTMVATFSVDYQRLNRWAYPIYAAVVILLALVLVIGISSGGSQRWLDLRLFAFQPSELAKLVLVLVLAKTLCYYEPGYTLTALGVPLMLCAPVLLLVLLQPDLGTAVLIFLIAMVVVVMSGLRMRSLLYFAVAAIATLPVGWQFLMMVATFSVDYQRLNRWAYPIYAAVVILLALVLVTGITSGGSQRWLDLKFFAFQPSELAKLVLVLVLAKTLCYYEPGYSLTALGVPLMLCAPVLVLVLLQPDLGTAGLIFLIAMVVVVMSGLRVRSLLYFAIAAIATLPVGWQFLKPYQKTRLWTFMNPESDPLGAGYHVVQSKIAIGSGQLWGKGYLQGSQNRLEFLPEQHTDFIFAVFAEEWGFSGCLLLLAGYALMILLALRVVRRAQDRFGVLLATGMTAILFWQFTINIGMVTGLMPVVGIPLPLISYGGSSLVTTMVAVGLLISISMRRNTRP